MKKLIPVLLILIICWGGCKKDSKQNPGNGNSGIKIEVVKGDSQRDTIGNLLKDTVMIKVTDNGAVVKNYIAQFVRSGCTDVNLTEAKTSSSGYAKFGWYLSGDVGTQSLKIVILDNNRNKKDSITVKATAIAATHGWHRSGCVQNFPVNSLSKLSTGRLFASINGTGYPYYSDNNAASWQPLKTFPSSYSISKIISSSSNELFLAAQNSGIFYSSDAGKTWTNRVNGINDLTGFSDIAYTKKGRLIFCTGNNVYLSTDKGANWTDVGFSLPSGQSYNPCEQLNGDLYIIGSDAELYKSTNQGTTWVNQGSSKGNFLLATVESLYIDDAGIMYVGIPHNGPGTNGELYKSADKGATWTNVFSAGPAQGSFSNITQINEINGIYYFSFAGRGVYSSTDFNTFSNITSRFASFGLLSYTVAGNSAFVIGSPGFGAFYYVK